MADVSQIKLPNGSVYDLIDEKSGYITAEYIENKTDYEIPVSRVGEIVVGETAIGTDSTNFPTSKAVVDYVDERVVQEIDAIDVGVTRVNGKTGSVTLSASDLGAITRSDLNNELGDFENYIQNQIPASTSQLTNDSGFITASDVIDEKVRSYDVSAQTSASYDLMLSQSNDTASTKYRDHGYLYYDRDSTTARLTIGGGSRSGIIRLINSNGVLTDLISSATSLRTITLPNATGTIALTSDIPTVPTNISSFTNDSGYLTASDIASVMTYKGTKANYAALPSTGNTTGDVWHLTDTGAEWAWDGSAWQELGTAIDLSGYLQTGDIASWAKQSSKPSYALSELTGATDVQAIEGLTGTSGLLKKTAANTWTLDTNTYLTSYTETDPVFSASAASGITATDISNWNGKSDTDEKLKTTTLTSGVMYLIGGDDSSTASTKYINNGLSYQLVNGRTSMLIIGTDGYSGALRLAGSTSNTRVHIQHNATANRTITLPDKDGTVALTSDIPDTSSFLTSETDPVFSASAAAGITATDISNWNAKVSDDKTWNGVTLSTSTTSSASNYYIPSLSSTSGTTAYLYTVTNSPSNNAIAKYDSSAYLKSTTPSANDNSTKVATTAYVDAAIPKVYSSTNTGGYLTMATLPIYDGTVV